MSPIENCLGGINGQLPTGDTLLLNRNGFTTVFQTSRNGAIPFSDTKSGLWNHPDRDKNMKKRRKSKFRPSQGAVT